MVDQNCVVQQETAIKSLDSHKWLNQRCLESKQALCKCLENSFYLKPDSAMSFKDLALKISALRYPVKN